MCDYIVVNSADISSIITLDDNEETAETLSLQPRHYCDACNRSYKNKGHLTAHKNFECGKPPLFECPLCHKRFTQPQSLNRHIKEMHKSENIKF